MHNNEAAALKRDKNRQCIVSTKLITDWTAYMSIWIVT